MKNHVFLFKTGVAILLTNKDEKLQKEILTLCSVLFFIVYVNLLGNEKKGGRGGAIFAC